MCFSSPKVINQPTGPTDAELQASADAQVAADAKLREEQERRAKRKRDDITAALDSKAINKSGSGGAGRRSMVTADAQGFLGRFG